MTEYAECYAEFLLDASTGLYDLMFDISTAKTYSRDCLREITEISCLWIQSLKTLEPLRLVTERNYMEYLEMYHISRYTALSNVYTSNVYVPSLLKGTIHQR